MSLFKRKTTSESQPATEDRADEVEVTDSGSAVVGAGDVTPASAGTPAAGRPHGPLDVSEVDGPQGRLDIGSLWLPLVEGLEIQLQMDESTGQVTGAFVVLGESAVQLQAFAAPRSEGIWREICDEIAAGITEQGGTADVGEGHFGHELLARVPAQQPDGKVGFQPLRFTGVDGPRWLLRAVFHGAAAIDPAAARDLEAVVGQVVVRRGAEPMGPRELLPLTLPEGAEAAAEDDGDDEGDAQVPAAAEPDGGGQGFDDLKPFERGPEVTERR